MFDPLYFEFQHLFQFLISLSQIKFCQGFPAPLYRPLEVQGHLVSAVEIWSRRTDEDTEEVKIFCRSPFSENL